MKSRGRLIFASLFLLFLSATALWAEDDPPGRVARVQYVSGSVSVQPQGTGDWVAASQNRPLTATDNIWTDKNSRAELSVGTAFLRMDSESSVTFTTLNDGTIQVQLHQGTLALHLRKLYDGEIYEIDTPNMAFTVQKSGDYRFDVNPESDTSSVTVFKGKGDATGDGPSVRVEAKERATFNNGTSLAHTFSPAPGFDGFDDWGRVRDSREGKYASGQYVSPDVIGADDLDAYGAWQTAPQYGPIWVPRHVVAGWAPYRYGHWVWISPWGWTWVDDAPWGFAPFHYGRWVYYNNYWGWAPGPVYARPVYAPALVAWFGGSNWGVSLGFGGGPGYGWCPLGFGEPFVPWYRGGRGYFQRVNVSNTRITNINNITNIYVNKGNVPWRYTNVRGGTAVSAGTIVSGRPVSGAIVRVPENEFRNAGFHGGPTPTRTSMLGGNAGRPAAIPPQRSFARPVVSRMNPPARNHADNAPFSRGNRPESGGFPQRADNPRTPDQARNGDRPTTFGNGGRSVPRPPMAENPRSGAITRPQEGNTPAIADRNPRWEGTNSNSPRSGASGNNRPDAANNGRGSISRPISGSVPRPQEGNTPVVADRNPHWEGTNSNSPRPGGFGNNRPEAANNGTPRPTGQPNVARPQTGNNGGNDRPNMPPRMDRPTEPARSGASVRNTPDPPSVNVARPPANSQPPANNGNRGRDQPRDFRNSQSPRSMSVPRPTGRVLPASTQAVDHRSSQGRDYSAASRGYSNPQPRSHSSVSSMENRSYGSYAGSPRYSAPSMRSGGQRSMGGGSPAMSASRSSGSGSFGGSHGGGHGGGRGRN